MLRIGLSGGIGAGKSTVSSTFAAAGGIIVDGDVIAREVVEPGTEGLAKLVEAFGEDILLPDGSLNRPALAAVAFSDEQKRQTLNSIVHPLVGKRRAELIDAAPVGSVVVEDIPLLVESQMAPLFPLVVMVHADEDVRVARLIEYRGFSEDDARARIAAQATVEQRQAVADVWLDNSGRADELAAKARELWEQRIIPFARNVQAGVPATVAPQLVTYDATWPEQASRILARLKTACGHRAVRVDHIGSTAVPGLDAKDVIDIQVTVASLELADELTDLLQTAGYPKANITEDVAKADARSTVAEFDHSDDAALWYKRFHASADPGRPTNVHIRVDGWPGQQFALLFPAWIAANPEERVEYLALKHDAMAAAPETSGAYADAKEPWLVDAYRRAWAWADETGWRP
ncbi:dephospho-CoA kinase [Mycobacterium sp. CBMA293]|uniref:dephospho-CoA kinase n=1 Tax=unclassified Mycolicibacterium TaxID=2636767 RepID=UPI0012DDDB1F|nr:MULTISPECIES: dephospho-CoA kinase [unclassified Mycolicibacterium]MUL45179.1 dephospho-CoA kinase [Mycolicibacterium sp. CBMA 360]MUL56698.1 dephospho-CoA kinase [Mycolicibacterium sp. CBMA 335]MUL69737.1 dephospho-CoA kinase [Mycolicibacterium sp. CBMA 311]MUL91785.1 dephospho-CoA kinase [Mycolicibacterium sp. CBMA 230]MUM05525.1 dephospho-CoA kinase [Mycolicibacterium sp. CBMA 213]